MLRHVLTPIRIGPVELPNRVVRTGHGTGIGGGTISDALIDYHVERAKGGVGLTIIELLSVHKTLYPFLRQGEPGIVEGYHRLMERVRPHGMKVFQQLGHNGNEVPPADGGPPWSASDTVGAFVQVQSEAMTKGQIEELKQAYLDAVRDCIAGGLDGVELHMAHGFLVQQFLSPLYNFRTDEYGGSFENRTRLAVELLTGVRAVMPPTMALGVRLSSEQMESGNGPDDVSRVVQLFQELKLVDYINLSIGTNYNAHKIMGAMHEPTGYELPSDRPVKAVAKLPVLVSGRFRTLEEADQAIHEGSADLVALTRAHIADPLIVRKTIEGREDQIRPCIGCNHGCVGGLMTLGRIGCAVNVAVGAEAVLSEDLIERTSAPLAVLVVGGGPAGLEAARVAALVGHRVILAEANSSLGGSIAIARRAPRRGGIGDIIDWLEREVYRLGVEVRLSSYLQADDVREIAPDVVIVATGSRPRVDGRHSLSPGKVTAGIDQPNVVSSHDLLLDRSNRDWGTSALIFDDTGHYEGIAAAEFLSEKGLAVTYATSHNSFAPKIEASISTIPALERLSKGRDFKLVLYAELHAVEGATARLGYRYGGKPLEAEADTVVFVSHNACNRELLDELADFPGRVIGVGDVRSPRYLQTAIREGHMAARFL